MGRIFNLCLRICRQAGYALLGAEAFGAKTSFGDFYFYHYAGEGFSIWKSVYDIRRPARVIGRANQSVIELTSMFEGSFDIDWTGVTAGKLPLKQIELYHAPWIDNVAEFRGGRQIPDAGRSSHRSPARALCCRVSRA